MRTLLRSKLQEVIVTDANPEYEGSITIGTELMEAAGLVEYEQVEVNGKETPARIKTYVIAGKEGQVMLNGGAAQHFKKGDKVHVLAFSTKRPFPDEELRIVYTDENNAVTEIVKKYI